MVNFEGFTVFGYLQCSVDIFAEFANSDNLEKTRKILSILFINIMFFLSEFSIICLMIHLREFKQSDHLTIVLTF